MFAVISLRQPRRQSGRARGSPLHAPNRAPAQLGRVCCPGVAQRSAIPLAMRVRALTCVLGVSESWSVLRRFDVRTAPPPTSSGSIAPAPGHPFARSPAPPHSGTPVSPHVAVARRGLRPSFGGSAVRLPGCAVLSPWAVNLCSRWSSEATAWSIELRQLPTAAVSISRRRPPRGAPRGPSNPSVLFRRPVVDFSGFVTSVTDNPLPRPTSPYGATLASDVGTFSRRGPRTMGPKGAR
jgi:hypothetical protein